MSKTFITTVLAVSTSIVVTGLALDEAARGTFGGTVQGIANKVTKGFGV